MYFTRSFDVKWKKQQMWGGGGVTQFCYVRLGWRSSLVLRSVTEEGGGSGKRQNWRYVKGE